MDLGSGVPPCVRISGYCRSEVFRLFSEFYQGHPIAAILITAFLSLFVFGVLYWLRESRHQKPWTPHTPYEPPRFEKPNEH